MAQNGVPVLVGQSLVVDMDPLTAVGQHSCARRFSFPFFLSPLFGSVGADHYDTGKWEW